MAYQYTNEEYLDMVRAYAQADYSLQGAIKLYREMFPKRRVPTASVILNTNQRLRDFGQFHTPKHAQGRGQMGHAASQQEDILEYFEINPEASTRKAAKEFGVSQWSVWNLLHEKEVQPYHFGHFHQLSASDYGPRINFCQWFLQNTDKNILFTDEATFTKDGVFNIQNEQWWSNSNPYVTRKDANQHKLSVNVWAGIINNRLLGPYFIEGRLNNVSYLDILKSAVNDMLYDVPLSNRKNLFYQHGGAPANYQTQVREHLNKTFGDRWIGRGGPVPWPARSPDLTPLDYYLWAEVKRLVYAVEYENIEELKLNITNAFETIKNDPFVLNHLKDNMRRRAELCISRKGAHFENFLRFV
ncbi:unnamed protein product [Euphydryas editha]|uniref:DUF4817 domain-containing protein n=1 Tax=Euphydryas editha TaxID=104508 RepID=A0AAU9UPV2_EUPED|nr:unnamed protein product [Euphydryas editha]